MDDSTSRIRKAAVRVGRHLKFEGRNCRDGEKRGKGGTCMVRENGENREKAGIIEWRTVATNKFRGHVAILGTRTKIP